MNRNRITPDNITELAHNEIFVFGSNLQGWHGGGAARTAVDKFGAIEGLGVGPQDNATQSRLCKVRLKRLSLT